LAEVRASLSQAETTLLEKESKLAYAESINQQLTARVSKLTHRESSTAEYVRKLESRLDEKEAQSQGADPLDAETIAELRLENQRMRDNEQSAEAYLAVLEENLAEADADIEFWKREVDRLERVVERQRGLRKLDTLLDELDEVQNEALERAKSEIADSNHESVQALQIPEIVKDGPTEPTTTETVPMPTPNGPGSSDEKENRAPSDDNLLKAELASLRKSHETTVRKLEDLTNTYNSSLECIAELKEQLEDSHTHHSSTTTQSPSSSEPKEETPPFLEPAGVRTLKTAALASALLAAGPQRSFSRSLSSEGYLAGVSDTCKNEMNVNESEEEDVEALKDEIEDLRQKVHGLEELRREHAKLTENYNESMDLLDELKAQLQRPPPSPVQPVSPMRPGLIRSRSVSDLKLVQLNERATRALDVLSDKIVDLAGDDEELKKTLQSSLSVVTTEVISKSTQNVQQATEITTLRADVDAKSRLIVGLTKAQSRYIILFLLFLTFRTADPAYISALQNQLAEKESEHKQVIETMKAREIELINKVEDLAQQLEINTQEFDKHKNIQQDYRKLLNEILVGKKRNSSMSQSSVDSYRSASAMMTHTSRTELTSDYGDHDTLDKELAEADGDEEEVEHTQLISELKAMLKDDSRLSIIDTTEHSRVVKDLRQELEEVRSAYEEDTSELQKTLSEVKSQLLHFSRQRSLSESSGSDGEKESGQSAIEKVKSLQRQIAQQREDHKEVIQLLETAQLLATDRERKANDLSMALESLRTDHVQASAKADSLSAELETIKSQHMESLQLLDAAQLAAKEFEQKHSNATKLLESVTAERDIHSRTVSDLQTKLDKLAKQHEASVKKTESSHNEEIQNLKKDNSEYLTIIQHLKDQVSESETSISTHLLQITSFQQKLEASTKESDKAKRAKAAVDRDLKELRNEVNVLTRQRQEARDRLAEVSELLNQLQREYDTLKLRKGEQDALLKDQAELVQDLQTRLAEFEARPSSADPTKRLRSGSLTGRWSNSIPTPPPQMPLPPLPSALPNPPVSPTFSPGRTTPTLQSRSLARTNSQDQLLRSGSRDQLRSPEPDAALLRQIEEKDSKIANLEKQFHSERQLVQTLEEALSDTEKSMKQLKKQTNSLAAEKEMLHTKMLDVSHQLEIAKKEAMKSRDSIQQLDEARAQRAKVCPSSFRAQGLMVGGSSEETVGGSDGGDCASEKVKIFVLLNFYCFIVISLFFDFVFLALGGKDWIGEIFPGSDDNDSFEDL